MARARKASVTQSKLGMILYGEQFTGKSTMAMQLAYFKRPDGKPFRVLYLDPETGSIDDYLGELEANGVNLDNIYIVYTQSLGEVEQYIEKVKNKEDFYELDEDGNETDNIILDADGEPFRADALVVDGTSILNLTTKQSLVEFSRKRNRVKADKAGLVGDAKVVKVEGAGLEWSDWQKVNYKGQNLILDLAASGVHYIATARETDEKESVKQSDGTVTSVSTGKKIPDGFKGMTYNAKTVIRMFRDEDGNVCAHVEKDRTHVHEDNTILEDPSLTDWQSVIDKTSDKKEFVVKNDLKHAVDVDQKIVAKEVLGEDNSADEDVLTNAVNIEELKKEIKTKISVLPPTEKTEMKKKMADAGLPTAFKNVTDADILQKVLDLFD